MGFNQDLNELDALTAQMMIEISCEIDNLNKKQREVEAAKAGGKKR